MKIKANPFEENIKSYNEYEIADWIFRCRNLIKHKDTNQDNFILKVKAHCDNWKNFREQNIKVFESEVFKKGMIMSAVARPKIIVKCGKEKIDITNSFYPENMGYMVNFPSNSIKDFVSTLKKCVVQSMDEYYEIVENMFDNEPDDSFDAEKGTTKNYKKKIANAIKYLSADDIFELRFDELSEKMKDTSSYSHTELIEELKKYKTYVPKTRQTSINMNLGDREISKSVYFEWLNEETEEREFTKKFFVNLSFYLSLPKEYFENLLMLNGYSTTESLRIFDAIIATSFECGYSQIYASTLIAGENEIRKQRFVKKIQEKEIEKEKKKQEKLEKEKQEPEETISTEENEPNPYKKVDLYLVPEIYKRFFVRKDEDERTE